MPPGGTLRATAMGVDVIFNTIDTSHSLRASERATQFTVTFQTAYRLRITASLDYSSP